MMPGLNLRAYGGVSARPQATTAPQAATVTAAAFGPGYGADSGDQGMGAALTPNDAFGVSFWIGVLAIAGLIFIRHSLPR